ncbi:uncharacterized protein LOC124459395 isoform X2 [Xenia sp. Carnegie-2017]|uniref:uncharacterized protein LOC124459395 isoform X2 n=1 Tax=Xenia sp. Carnegie-2017 TaxID=2897299 RepID=UPI001F050338|nr:uncharacterized protein LOC124459395 isoform X2 [Xenia sp. Carnegie-2017]
MSFANDGVHRDMENDREYTKMFPYHGRDDYLATWLPNIKQSKSVWFSDSCKRIRRTNIGNLLCIVPQSHQQRKLENHKKYHVTKTYNLALKCSPIELRESKMKMKKSKLESDFLKRPLNKENYERHPKKMAEVEENNEEMQKDIFDIDTEESQKDMGILMNIPKGENPRTSLSLVELRHDKWGTVGSFHFQRTAPVLEENSKSQLRGGKVRIMHKRNENTQYLADRYKTNELMIQCQSVMIHPKVLTKPKKQEGTEQNKEISAVLSTKTSHDTLEEKSLNDSITVPTIFPQLPFNKSPKQACKKEILETDEDLNNKDVDSHASIPRRKDKLDKERKSPSTKIIIPFGERETKYCSKIIAMSETQVLTSNKTGKENDASCEKGIDMDKEGIDMDKEGIDMDKESLKKETASTGFKTSPRKKEEFQGNSLTFSQIQSRYLKDSSNLHEQVGVSDESRETIRKKKPQDKHKDRILRTQYLTINTDDSLLRKFRIPTGREDNNMFVGRENDPPKTTSQKFGYSQRGIAVYSKEFVGIKMNQTDEDGLRMDRKGDRTLEKEDDGKRVEFLVKNSRYFNEI